MLDVKPLIIPDTPAADLSQVFLFVNPIAGRHASFNKKPKVLAVFSNEEIGRSYEPISSCLQRMIGYYVNWDEMLSIAQEECRGQYELITTRY